MKQFFILLLVFVCSSMSASCPNVTNPVALPSLDPIQFSYSVQITVADKNLTLDAHEFYNFMNDTFYLVVDKAFGSNGTSVDRTQITYDYKYNQTFVVETVNGSTSCTVQDLNSSLPHQPTVFGVGVEVDPLMVQQAFYWNGSYNATLVNGSAVIDGIRTNHYNTCIDFDDANVTYFIDIYYSQDSWTMPAGQNVPVLLTLNATYTNNTSRIYTYKFSDYHPSQVPRPRKPHKPSEIICHGRKDVPPFPFGNHTQYHMKSQIKGNANGFNFLFDLTSYIDHDNNLTKREGASFIRIDDFNQGLAYNLNATTGRCHVTPIPLNSSFIAEIHNTTVTMRRFVDPRKQFNLTYGGVASYRGILCNVWIAQTPISNVYDRIHRVPNASFYINYYFTVDKWNGVNALVGMKDTIVANVNGSVVRSGLYADVYSESFKVYPEDFDISSCYDDSMRSTVVVKFSAFDKAEISSYPIAFQRAMVEAVAYQAGISKIRVKYAGLSFSKGHHASGANDHDSGLYVWVTLLDVPDVQGDATEVTPQANLTTALAKLYTSVVTNEFTVRFTGSKMNKLNAFYNYWEIVPDVLEPQQPPSPHPAPPAKTGFSGGTLAGLSIAMLVVGVVIGSIVCHCRNGRMRSQYAYSMQN